MHENGDARRDGGERDTREREPNGGSAAEVPAPLLVLGTALVAGGTALALAAPGPGLAVILAGVVLLIGGIGLAARRQRRQRRARPGSASPSRAPSAPAASGDAAEADADGPAARRILPLVFGMLLAGAGAALSSVAAWAGLALAGLGGAACLAGAVLLVRDVRR
jgi:hypothetical protein